MNKKSLIVGLIGLNVFLAACLVGSAWSPPSALAQGARNSGSFLMVAGQAEESNDALYLLDGRNHMLHAYRTNYPRVVGEPIRVALMDSRDLRRDFVLEKGRD